MNDTTALYLPGRCANGSQLDSGTRNHAVPMGQARALCGAKPGQRSPGWCGHDEALAVTCPRCLVKIAKAAKSPVGEVRS